MQIAANRPADAAGQSSAALDPRGFLPRQGNPPGNGHFAAQRLPIRAVRQGKVSASWCPCRNSREGQLGALVRAPANPDRDPAAWITTAPVGAARGRVPALTWFCADVSATGMAMGSLYRAEALEHLAQRERIDGLATVTAPYDWLALAMAAAACATILGWGVWGEIETTVHADAVVVIPDDRRAVVAPASGRVTEILVEPGDYVNKGGLLARLETPELNRLLSAARERERFIVQELSASALDAGLSQVLVDARAEVARLTAIVANDAIITSPDTGEVTEFRLFPGAVVAAGDEVARVRVGPAAAPVAIASLPSARTDPVQPGASARLHCGHAGDTVVLDTSVGEVNPVSAAIRGHLAALEAGSLDQTVVLRFPDNATAAEGLRCVAHVVIDTLSPLKLLLEARRPS